MAYLEIEKLNFRYPGAEENALTDIDLSIEEGSFVVLCGASGSGKTTLLRNLKQEITPIGKREGRILYQGEDLELMNPLKSTSEIGMVFQDPENQIVLDTVIQELAFSLENQGLDSEIIKKRIAEIVTFFALEEYLNKSIHELSGGQKQIVNLCSVLMLRPKVLLLDEPTSQLDPIGAKKFLKMIYDLNQELSLTVILSEHRLEDIFPLADKIIYLHEGKITQEASPKEFCKALMENKREEAWEFLPALGRMYQSVCRLKNKSSLESLLTRKDAKDMQGATIQAEEIPLTVREAKQFLKENEQVINISKTKSELESELTADQEKPYLLTRDVANSLIRCKNVYFKYNSKSPLILRNLSLTIERGEFLAILGANGSGKSTLLKTIAGLLLAQKGQVYLHNTSLKKMSNNYIYRKIGYVAQNTLLHFTGDTVNEVLKASSADISFRDQLMDLFDLRNLLKRHPYDLSGGQQQKLAIASVLLTNPDILLLDEPTKGLDPVTKVKLIKILKQLQKNGLTILMSTHDLEFAAKYATRCALLFAGEISFSGSPREFFSSNYYYTTAINRALRDYVPQALTERDVIYWK